MFVTITYEDTTQKIMEVSTAVWETMNTDFATQPSGIYPLGVNEDAGRQKINWSKVESLVKSETKPEPALPVVISNPPVFTEDSMKNW